jgi:uncharacterized membrane protein YqjE
VRLLWLLPKAAPALLRHLVAYIDLAGLDLARAQRDLAAEVVASAVAAICGMFAIFMACLAVVACTWDTPYRVAAIAWMGGGFLLVAVAAAVYRARIARAKAPLFGSVREQWQADRVLLEHILSSTDED